MALNDAISCAVELSFEDGSKLNLARVDMETWGRWTERIVKRRLEAATEILNSDPDIPAPARVKLKLDEINRPPPSLPEVVSIVTRSALHIDTLLIDQAVTAGHSADEAKKLIKRIGEFDKTGIASVLIDAPPEGQSFPLLVPLARNGRKDQGMAGQSESADSNTTTPDSKPENSPTASSSIVNAA